MSSLLHALSAFGLSGFRPGQEEVISSVLSGRPTIAVMPTGAGKSLCYQLPATLLPGLTLVVSPLIALMKDQVDALQRRGIAAFEINSSLDEGERLRRIDELGSAKLVYVAPERFRSASFFEKLCRVPISLLAIDEAHCISEWGHDFRPDYLKLGEFFQKLPSRPKLVALTATATPEVREDIGKTLGLAEPAVFVRGFDRPNLTFRVEKVAVNDKATRVAALLREHTAGAAGIVYVSTRKNAEQLGDSLQREGLRVGVYHAGLSEESRNRVQGEFMEGRCEALVATNAFGMGVDKANVRLVVHADVPRTLEAYYQEAGRAGRDGKASQCVLLFHHQDIRIQEYLIEGSHPPAEVLRSLWKAVKDDPFLCQSEEQMQRACLASNTLQAASAFRLLRSAGLLEEQMPGFWIAQRPSTAVFDPEAPSRRAAHEKSKLERMVSYAYSRRCRRRAILEYFGDSAAEALASGCGSCDLCLGGIRRLLTVAEQKIAKLCLQLLLRCQGRFGMSRVVGALLGSGDLGERFGGLRDVPEYGTLRGEERDRVFSMLELLEGAGFAQRTSGEYPKIDLTRTGKSLALDPARLATTEFVITPEETPVSSRKKRSKTTTSKAAVNRTETKVVPLYASVSAPSFVCDDESAVTEDAEETPTERRLQKLRSELAAKAKVPAYVIWSNRSQKAIASLCPKTEDALLAVPGIGPKKVALYGQAILEALQQSQGDETLLF